VQEDDLTDLTDAFLLASRVLVSVAARSRAGAGDVTLPQYRALVLLAGRGPQNVAALAEALAVNPSTVTRLCDRLEAKGLVARQQSPSDRREVVLRLSRRGAGLVRRVTAARREEIGRILRKVPAGKRAVLVDALRTFGDAAGEVPEQSWSLGWSP
jgi:DNA-binding MarR family transcriptional regulator